MTNLNKIQQQLESYQDPYLQSTWGEGKCIKAITQNDKQISISLAFGFPVDDIKDEIKQTVIAQLCHLASPDELQITIKTHIQPHTERPKTKPIAPVKNMIAIASGKGGVGKSTSAIHLAIALVQMGAKVGLLDADIYGPNVPHMLGIDKLITPEEPRNFRPVQAHGIYSMSMGYLVDVATPMIWRGPMVSAALQQLLFDTSWPELDYLLIDLPPGTGDIHLTLSKKAPISGAAVITTPQQIALLDARKGVEMFRKVKVPILGIIENMSEHICTGCGQHESLFGTAGGTQLAEDCDTELLGRLPLALEIRKGMDQGKPITTQQPEADIALMYKKVARRMTAKLALQPVNYAAKFPNIVVES